eukprot:TRINITY_DN12343_c0_g1_i1.p1 TRINITY_DN12343_c0_g1~~TRINITY_DN12343_c0_g1_i1.p1  ORF type:complete len:1090 (+),score=331.68 TRINITY_DN12343_c0_g1_i1:73-3270(+)
MQTRREPRRSAAGAQPPRPLGAAGTPPSRSRVRRRGAGGGTPCGSGRRDPDARPGSNGGAAEAWQRRMDVCRSPPPPPPPVCPTALLPGGQHLSPPRPPPSTPWASGLEAAPVMMSPRRERPSPARPRPPEHPAQPPDWEEAAGRHTVLAEEAAARESLAPQYFAIGWAAAEAEAQAAMLVLQGERRQREAAERTVERLSSELERLSVAPPPPVTETVREKAEACVAAADEAINEVSDDRDGERAVRLAETYSAAQGADVVGAMRRFARQMQQLYEEKQGDVVQELLENLRFPDDSKENAIVSLAALIEALGRRHRLKRLTGVFGQAAGVMGSTAASGTARKKVALAAFARRQQQQAERGSKDPEAPAEGGGLPPAVRSCPLALMLLRSYTQRPEDLDRDLGHPGVPPPPRAREGGAIRKWRQAYATKHTDWDWTSGEERRNGSLFGPVCAAMRDQGPGGSQSTSGVEILGRWAKWSSTIAAFCCMDAPPGTAPLELYRGLGGGGVPAAVVDAHRKLKPGDLLGWPALSSLSCDLAESEAYMLGNAANSTGSPSAERPGTLLFKIRDVRTGLKLDAISQYPKEGEHLLGPGTILRIDTVSPDPRNPFGEGLIIAATCLGPLGTPLSKNSTLSAFFDSVRGDAQKACDRLLKELARLRNIAPRQALRRELCAAEEEQRRLLGELAAAEGDSLAAELRAERAELAALLAQAAEGAAAAEARRYVLLVEERHAQELRELGCTLPPRRGQWHLGQRVEARFGPFARWFPGVVAELAPQLRVRIDCDSERLYDAVDLRPLDGAGPPPATPPRAAARTPSTADSEVVLPEVDVSPEPDPFDAEAPWEEVCVGDAVRVRWRYGSWFEGTVTATGAAPSALVVRIGSAELRGFYSLQILAQRAAPAAAAAEATPAAQQRAPLPDDCGGGQPDPREAAAAVPLPCSRAASSAAALATLPRSSAAPSSQRSSSSASAPESECSSPPATPPPVAAPRPQQGTPAGVTAPARSATAEGELALQAAGAAAPAPAPPEAAPAQRAPSAGSISCVSRGGSLSLTPLGSLLAVTPPDVAAR